ncbi:hypothetical protein OZX74_04435 [Bifidobacterium sp. ESL0798]|uniref:hypothetical protein n=1 Tax=Bifidobacterium sp. ESL0798 TaxID=2983235 RepID=UPI0023F82211|nr:hypothetical protein [Bifidobacterium sp. ESL0798]WEV74765.1 hypothetical protein OZX74_04435 [Bifidobacterium sp. ESL0798]
MRKEHGQIAYHLKFKDLTKVSSKVNPEMLANVGGVMTQMALQQSMDEITDYLAEIDRKIDNLLQDQKDQVIADLVGTANMIDETMTIRDKVGMVTDTTWSKVADCPKDLASAQSYALIKMKNLATDLSKKKDVKDSEKLTDTLLKEVTDWSAVIANSINEQDKLYVIELDRVMVEYPQEVSQYREGINAARRKRLHDIANEITLLSKNIQDSAQIIREQKVWSPRKVTKALKSLKETNDLLSEFAVKIGVDTDFVEIEMAPHWKDAAGKLIADTTVEIGEGAKQIGSGAVKFGKGAGQKLGEGAELVGDYAGQLGESIKENQNKLAEKLASERAKETQKPKTGKAESRPKLHDLLLKYKDSKE